jgi:hypothetical protein
MAEKVAGIFEVYRTNDGCKIAIKHPGLKTDANGMSQIVLSPRQARHFANVLIMHAGEAEDENAVRRTNVNETVD